jgi:serine/threonine protein kinase, bacterial
VQRFRREADAAARLNNPHVIPIHTYREIDGRLYVDMRLIDGRDLQTDVPLAALTRERQTSLIKGAACAASDKTGETR